MVNPPSSQGSDNTDVVHDGDIESNRRRSNRFMGCPPSYEDGYNNIPRPDHPSHHLPNDNFIGIISPHGIQAQQQYPASAPPHQQQYLRDYMQEMQEREHQQQGRIVQPSAIQPHLQHHPALAAHPPPVPEVHVNVTAASRQPCQIFPQNLNLPVAGGSLLFNLQRDDISHHSHLSHHGGSNHSSSHHGGSNHSSSNQSIHQPEYPVHKQQPWEVTDLQANVRNLHSTVQALQRNIGTITDTNNCTANHLTRIDESNLTISNQLVKNAEDLRRFTREDIGPIIAANITSAFKQHKKSRKKKRKKKRRKHEGGSDDSTNSSSDSSSDSSSSDDSSEDDSSKKQPRKKGGGKPKDDNSIFVPTSQG